MRSHPSASSVMKCVIAHCAIVMCIALPPAGVSAQAGRTGARFSATDQRFLQFAVHTESRVELAQIALKKSTSPEVRKFAQMLIEDFTKAGTEVKALAAQEGIAIPQFPGPSTEEKQVSEAYKRMLLDATWDRQMDKVYLGNAVNEFIGVVQEYGREAHRQMPGNDVLKAYAQKMWPLLMKDAAAARQTAAQFQVPL